MKPWAWIRTPSGVRYHIVDEFLNFDGKRTGTTIHYSYPLVDLREDEPKSIDWVAEHGLACRSCVSRLSDRVEHYTRLLAIITGEHEQ